jgi:7-cyano-7-deazaguanine tRNA-ribosyltransferase
MPFKVHALGSPTEVMERYNFPVLVDMIATAKRHLPPDRPLHLFGAGHPMMFSMAVALGCDLFDSASYALFAKDSRYMTTRGTLHLSDLRYLPCSCPVCRSHTAEDLKVAPRVERERLLAEHNLHVCMSEIQTIKQAITEGGLWDLVEERSKGHPSMAAALRRLGAYREDLEKGSPGFKGHGAFYYGAESLTRPEVAKHQRLLTENYRKPAEAEVLLLLTAPPSKPFNGSTEYRSLEEKLKLRDEPRIHACFVSAPYGVIPVNLSETYPLSQFDIAEPIDSDTAKMTAQSVAEYIQSSGHRAVILHRGPGALDEAVEYACMETCNKLGVSFTSAWNREPWSEDAFTVLADALKQKC